MSRPRRDTTGQRFGKQVVLKELGNDYVEIQCDCGTIKKSRKMYLLNGQSKSCGCGRYASKLPPIEVGDVFNRLTVVEKLGSNGRKREVLVQCSCRARKVVMEEDLRAGHQQSCGCLRRELGEVRNKSHGQAGRNRTKLYRTWESMRRRIGAPNRYPSYAENGIKICSEWQHFEPFRDYVNEHLGPCPERHSLDRINNRGGYEPGNLKWSSPLEQARNRGSNVYITVNKETRTIAEWAEKLGTTSLVICARRRNGWTAEEAVTTPVQQRAAETGPRKRR
jgi:hypothetical protein